jgi:hypothetical protein
MLIMATRRNGNNQGNRVKAEKKVLNFREKKFLQAVLGEIPVPCQSDKGRAIDKQALKQRRNGGGRRG